MSESQQVRATRRERDGSITEVIATLSPGRRDDLPENTICDVECPAVFPRIFQICGGDEQEEAMENGRDFLRSMLEHMGFELVDGDPGAD